MRQSLRASFGLLAMTLTVPLGHGLRQPVSLDPPAGFSFAGYWQCSGSVAGSGREHRSVYHGESSADGKWVDLTETDIEPKGYVGRYELGTSPSHDKLVFIDMNSTGYGIFDSPGWDGLGREPPMPPSRHYPLRDRGDAAVSTALTGCSTACSPCCFAAPPAVPAGGSSA